MVNINHVNPQVKNGPTCRYSIFLRSIKAFHLRIDSVPLQPCWRRISLFRIGHKVNHHLHFFWRSCGNFGNILRLERSTGLRRNFAAWKCVHQELCRQNLLLCRTHTSITFYIEENTSQNRVNLYQIVIVIRWLDWTTSRLAGASHHIRRGRCRFLIWTSVQTTTVFS